MSYEGTIVVEGVEYGSRLPRGRHGIPQALVTENQRDRLLDAATTIFAAEGFASLAVANVIQQAGVSRGTFYEIFDNKIDCLLAAQQRAFDRLNAAIVTSCSAESEWPQGVAAAVASALDFVVEFPDEARLILASGHPSAEPQLARDGIAADEWLVALLREGSRNCPDARSPGDLTEQAAVGAAISIVGSCLASDRVGPMPELTTALVQIILTPYLGGDEAKRALRS
jgi:AcrR family transcriptional regulator